MYSTLTTSLKNCCLVKRSSDTIMQTCCTNTTEVKDRIHQPLICRFLQDVVNLKVT